MASQTVSPAEAEIARAKLAEMPPSGRFLDREAILAAPNTRPRDVTSVRVWDEKLTAWVILDSDDPDVLDRALDLDGAM